MGLATRDGQDGRQYTPVVETEYQSVPSAVLSRATMRCHLTSLATDEDIVFAVIIFTFSYAAGKNIVQSSTAMRNEATRFLLCGPRRNGRKKQNQVRAVGARRPHQSA